MVFGGGGIIKHEMCVLISLSIFVWNVSYTKKIWARYGKKMYSCIEVKYLSFLSDFHENWIPSTGF